MPPKVEQASRLFETDGAKGVVKMGIGNLFFLPALLCRFLKTGGTPVLL